MRIPYLDLRAMNLAYQEQLLAATEHVLQSGHFIGGGLLEKFESEFAQYTQSAYCVGTGNGLDALQLALMALEIGPGDEVIVPSHTYIATWLPISRLGATIIPAEPDLGSFHIAAHNIQALITPRTKAIIAVHLYGMPCDMDAICTLAQQLRIPVIEDAAQAHGAQLRGKRIGSHGDIVAWSFYPGKNLGALGDGGAITTQNPDIAKKIRALGNYGSSKKYHNDYLGINSRLDPLQAAFLSVKLPHLDALNQQRQLIAAQYFSALADIPQIALLQTPDYAQSVWHCFVIRCEQRDALQRHLAQHGIETLIHYPIAPHQQVAYRNHSISQQALPIAKRYGNTSLSLPIHPMLTKAEISYITQTICDFNFSV